MTLAEVLGIEADLVDEVAAAERFLDLPGWGSQEQDSSIVVHMVTALKSLPNGWATRICEELITRGKTGVDITGAPFVISAEIVCFADLPKSAREGDRSLLRNVALRSAIGTRLHYGTISTDEAGVVVVISGDIEMEVSEMTQVRLTMHLGDLQMSIDDYLELAEGSELSFEMTGTNPVSLMLGKIPVGKAVFERGEGELYLRITEVYGRKMLESRKLL